MLGLGQLVAELFVGQKIVGGSIFGAGAVAVV